MSWETPLQWVSSLIVSLIQNVSFLQDVLISVLFIHSIPLEQWTHKGIHVGIQIDSRIYRNSSRRWEKPLQWVWSCVVGCIRWKISKGMLFWSSYSDYLYSHIQSSFPPPLQSIVAYKKDRHRQRLSLIFLLTLVVSTCRVMPSYIGVRKASTTQ